MSATPTAILPKPHRRVEVLPITHEQVAALTTRKRRGDEVGDLQYTVTNLTHHADQISLTCPVCGLLFTRRGNMLWYVRCALLFLRGDVVHFFHSRERSCFFIRRARV